MANCRTLKKEVNNSFNEVINECFIFLEHTPSLNQENVQLIMFDTVELRNKLIYLINHPGRQSNAPDSLSTYYNKIRKEMQDHIAGLIERLDSLSG